MKVIMMAGGKGTRISALFPEIPKPMIPIGGIPVMEREIVELEKQGLTDIVVTIGHQADKIREYFGDGSDWGVKIEYFIEDKPLGNAGALFFIDLPKEFLLLNADAVFNVDFSRMIDFHQKHSAEVTLFTHPNSHPFDSGLIISDNSNVVEWITKEHKRPQFYKNRVNAGIHIISSEVIKNSGISVDEIKSGRMVDLDRDILRPLCGSGRMFCYDSPEYVKDMGTPERYYAVENDYMSGVIAAKNLKRKQKAIFMDRDGTINKYVGFLRNIDEMELMQGAAEAIRMINASEYLAVIITNQPVVARGEITVDELTEIHNKLETLLGLEGAYLDAIYYCPHHPHKGYLGEVKELKIDCECRKPKIGMFVKAAKDLNIDLSMSFMIGDSDVDVMAGQNAGCASFKITKDGLIGTIRKILEYQK